MSIADQLLLNDIEHLSDMTTINNGFKTVSGLANLKLALLHRLVTRPGSLAHRPDYGVGISDFQNAVNTLDNQRLIATRIAENFRRDPRVQSVESVSIIPNADPSMVKIHVKVIAIGRQEAIEAVFVPFSEGIQIG
jgi:phage baseplate assembly protein W